MGFSIKVDPSELARAAGQLQSAAEIVVGAVMTAGGQPGAITEDRGFNDALATFHYYWLEQALPTAAKGLRGQSTSLRVVGRGYANAERLSIRLRD